MMGILMIFLAMDVVIGSSIICGQQGIFPDIILGFRVFIERLRKSSFQEYKDLALMLGFRM